LTGSKNATINQAAVATHSTAHGDSDHNRKVKYNKNLQSISDDVISKKARIN